MFNRYRSLYRAAAALFITGLSMLIVAPSAHAQLERIPQVAVLDFSDPAHPGGDIVSRQAGDALVVEMTRSGRWDIVPRAQMAQQLQEQGVAGPLDLIAIRKMGTGLGVDFVATGTIASLSRDAATGRFQARVAVLLIDVASGEGANGAVASGTAATETEALQNAAYNAVDQINNYQLPQATVLNTRGTDSVLLNQGGRGGVQVGQEYVILRRGARVGRVRITSVGSDDSTADIIDIGRGIRPEDKARAVFSLPPFRQDRR